MKGTFTFLGSGTSRGVPMLCCHCEACTSKDPRDHHDRSCAMVTVGSHNILIDCGPDLRLQLLRWKPNVETLDAVLLTHAHADHADGLDDLLAFSQHMRLPIPFYGPQGELALLRDRYAYVEKLRFKPDGSPSWTIPQLDYEAVSSPFSVAGIPIVPLPLKHGRANTLGYRIGSMAYVCDCSHIPEETYPLLEGVQDLVIDALHWRYHPTHFCIRAAEAEIRKIGPQRAWLTHLTHDVLYARDQPLMLPGNTLAYDGLEFPIEIA